MRTRDLAILVPLALSLAACGNSNDPNPTAKAVTFWQDVAPIYNNKCVRCHQQGGIGPFRLDNYADAKTKAALELTRVTEGTMPPYHMVHDGTCGSFQDDMTLSDQQKTTIAAWITGGQAEDLPGEPGVLEMDQLVLGVQPFA